MRLNDSLIRFDEEHVAFLGIECSKNASVEDEGTGKVAHQSIAFSMEKLTTDSNPDKPFRPIPTGKPI